MGAAYRQSRLATATRRVAGRRHGLTLVAIALSLAGQSAVAAPKPAKPTPAAAAAPTALPQAQPATGGVAGAMGLNRQTPADRLNSALAQIGMVSCAATVQRAAHFLFEDGEVNFTVQPMGPDANRWPTVIMIEGAHAAMGKTRMTTLTVSPGAGCTGFYQQTIYWPLPCDQLKRTVFAAFGSSHPLLRDVQVSELNAGLQLYLMPAGAGCTSIKKEMFF